MDDIQGVIEDMIETLDRLLAHPAADPVRGTLDTLKAQSRYLLDLCISEALCGPPREREPDVIVFEE